MRSVISVFSRLNPVHFHDKKGRGYKILIDALLKIDPKNSELAARLAEPFSHWRRYDKARQMLMKKELMILKKTKGLSNNLFEIVDKSLVRHTAA